MSTPNQPPRVPPCQDCGGRQVANLGVVSGYEVGLHPNGRAVWHPMSPISAVVCLNCGRATFYAADLPKVREEAQEHPDWFVW